MCVYEVTWGQRNGSADSGDGMDVQGLCVWCVQSNLVRGHTRVLFILAAAATAPVCGDKKISTINDAAVVVSGLIFRFLSLLRRIR